MEPIPQDRPPPESNRSVCVLCLSGHDPVGGAGLQADQEAISALGVHPVGVVTALTQQDTRNVQASLATEPDWMEQSLRILAADCDIRAVKIGLIGGAAQVPVIAALIDQLQVPVVLDPVLRAGGGANLAGQALQDAMLDQLLPRTWVLTPNAAEARRLVPSAQDLDQCAQALLDRGCRHVLITGGDEPDEQVLNTLYSADQPSIQYRWPRLPETFHGAGCTLASALAARLSQGLAPAEAVLSAQEFVQGALQRARKIGRGRRIPGRVLSHG